MFLREVSYSLSIFFEIATGEALIGVIEESDQAFGFEDVSHLLPLFEGRVAAGGVVGTGVEQDHVSGLGVVGEVVDQSLEVQSLGFVVVVSVEFVLHSGLNTDVLVTRPRRVRNVDGQVFAQKLSREVEGHSHASRSTQTLHVSHLVLLKSLKVTTILKFHRILTERLKSSDRQVLMVHSFLVDHSSCLLHTFQYVRLTIVISISSHSQIHFIFILTFLKCHAYS